jgi:hypothetical protein
MVRRRAIAAITIGLVALAAVALAGCGGSAVPSHRGVAQIGPGVMGYVPDGTGAPVRSLSAARKQAERFAEPLGLSVGEVMRFANNYYAELVEPEGKPATEVLVDPRSGATWVEYGPAMMWNTKYGMMSGFVAPGAGGMMGGETMGGGAGMMGGWTMGTASADPTYAPFAPASERAVSATEAQRIADDWLSGRGSSLTAGEAEAFPGYYTLHVLRNGKIAGMLSVNAYTGAVWLHWWHGPFLSMAGA